MLQKPSLEELEGLSKTHLFLMDIGIWILSDRAVEVLMKRSLKEGTNDISYYDLYSDYGLALGEHPQTTDDEVNKLSVAILPLPGGEFYHFGTSRELISSTPVSYTHLGVKFDTKRITFSSNINDVVTKSDTLIFVTPYP